MPVRDNNLSTGRHLVYLRGGNPLCIAGGWAWTLDSDVTPCIASFERNTPHGYRLGDTKLRTMDWYLDRTESDC